MDDDAEAGSEEVQALDAGVQRLVVRAHALDGGPGQLSVHDGGVDAGLFEDGAVLQHATRCRAPPEWPGPLVHHELVPVDLFERRDDLLLVFLYEGLHAGSRMGEERR